MGNLEKLGILVIVILVVVVGVVAITPEETLFPEAGFDSATRDGSGETLDDRSRDDANADDANEGPRRRVADLPIWPTPDPEPAPQPEPDPRPDPAPAPAPAPAPSPDPVPVVPQFRDYTVRSGDSFYRIAETELGSSARWKEIAAANPDVDPLRMREGMVVRIPTGAAPGRSAATPRSEPARDGAGTYVVKNGDTPMGISQKLFGTTRHWKLILSHNGIPDAESLQRDVTLRIPDLPTTSSNPPTSARNSPLVRDAAPVRGSALAAASTYHVRKNDTLIAIARRELGKSGRWPEILELNGMDDPSDLRADTDIRLPPR